jgi:hypothetical protein
MKTTAIAFTISIAVLSCSGGAKAFDISDVQALIQQRDNLGVKPDLTQAAVSNLVLRAFYTGAAEMLSAQVGKTGRIYVNSKPLICLPTTVDNITMEVVQAAFESEVRNEAFYSQTYGQMWRAMPPSVPIMLALVRSYPCKE